jgi:hypothetical protein
MFGSGDLGLTSGWVRVRRYGGCVSVCVLFFFRMMGAQGWFSGVYCMSGVGVALGGGGCAERVQGREGGSRPFGFYDFGLVFFFVVLVLGLFYSILFSLYAMQVGIVVNIAVWLRGLVFGVAFPWCAEKGCRDMPRCAGEVSCLAACFR